MTWRVDCWDQLAQESNFSCGHHRLLCGDLFWLIELFCRLDQQMARDVVLVRRKEHAVGEVQDRWGQEVGCQHRHDSTLALPHVACVHSDRPTVSWNQLVQLRVLVAVSGLLRVHVERQDQRKLVARSVVRLRVLCVRRPQRKPTYGR